MCITFMSYIVVPEQGLTLSADSMASESFLRLILVAVVTPFFIILAHEIYNSVYVRVQSRILHQTVGFGIKSIYQCQ